MVWNKYVMKSSSISTERGSLVVSLSELRVMDLLKSSIRNRCIRDIS